LAVDPDINLSKMLGHPKETRRIKQSDCLEKLKESFSPLLDTFDVDLSGLEKFKAKSKNMVDTSTVSIDKENENIDQRKGTYHTFGDCAEHVPTILLLESQKDSQSREQLATS